MAHQASLCRQAEIMSLPARRAMTQTLQAQITVLFSRHSARSL